MNPWINSRFLCENSQLGRRKQSVHWPFFSSRILSYFIYFTGQHRLLSWSNWIFRAKLHLFEFVWLAEVAFLIISRREPIARNVHYLFFFFSTRIDFSIEWLSDSKMCGMYKYYQWYHPSVNIILKLQIWKSLAKKRPLERETTLSLPFTNHFLFELKIIHHFFFLLSLVFLFFAKFINTIKCIARASAIRVDSYFEAIWIRTAQTLSGRRRQKDRDMARK